MRKKILAANWKMNLTQSEAESYIAAFNSEIGEVDDVEVVIIPPFTAIPALVSASEKIPSIRIGAQNMHWEKSGAFTGEVSATMLRALFVKYVILGHSERRTLFGETDEIVNRKVRAALEAGLRPIFCIGETLRERDAGKVEEVLSRQVRLGLEGVAQKDLPEIVVAYEPCWAIGTGRTATPSEAEEAHAYIRSVLTEISSTAVADRVRIQYGGSVKPENTEELMRQKDIDGALIGGASLDPRSFVRIIRRAEAALA
ncbi:MAG TPA: triose-phosphate isomerase [Chthoniobacterales bacterium]|jgi:triosephosphate isomerase|nr:triose-phosphate isomerase [Chthoniobacterales bacterium]